jgi:hypothetical protein
MCRNPSKLTASDKGLCKSITVGDASKHEDVAQTFSESKADYVILATGNGMDLGKSDTREKTGGALAHVMKQSSFQDVKDWQFPVTVQESLLSSLDWVLAP